VAGTLSAKAVRALKARVPPAGVGRAQEQLQGLHGFGFGKTGRSVRCARGRLGTARTRLRCDLGDRVGRRTRRRHVWCTQHGVRLDSRSSGRTPPPAPPPPLHGNTATHPDGSGVGARSDHMRELVGRRAEGFSQLPGAPSHRYTRPPFITNATRRNAVMSLDGSPATPTRSAS
jgi:hypothetical protein